MDITQHLATTLKTLRQDRGWSLSKLAEDTGVSKAMLGQIERNESSPTVSTLWKIATGLNVPFSTFITPEADKQAVFDPQQQAMVVKPLFPWDETLKFDHFSITLAPGALSESTPHETGVIEHVVVISGELEMQLEGEWQTIPADSGIRFAGDKPHAYRNSSDRTVHFHSLIHYPR
ncbi:XRE family transcriptional regulator [Enterobacter ludwigii]|uniref:helix-turn-helix domain-containing protein n=1 Tax=unclassified Enterobacter TaxID=2608935 RepID=UPI001ABDEA4A|nr:helix-turn-helix transcriptional regulator [Enterobacter ludwigii]UOY72783.1 XRE family transcriptional regulator [Enterobacter ludwigii]